MTNVETETATPTKTCRLDTDRRYTWLQNTDLTEGAREPQNIITKYYETGKKSKNRDYKGYNKC